MLTMYRWALTFFFFKFQKQGEIRQARMSQSFREGIGWPQYHPYYNAREVNRTKRGRSQLLQI